MGEGQHLHLDDYPQTLRLLAALVGDRADKERLAYTPTEYEAFVDCERLSTAAMSSTEVAIRPTLPPVAPPSSGRAVSRLGWRRL